MKYTIEDLRNGKCAIENNGTSEELKKIIKLAFPYSTVPSGTSRYYYKHYYSKSWDYDVKTNLPIQSVKDFLEPEFVWGERIGYMGSDNKYFFVGMNPSRKDSVICVNEDGVVYGFHRDYVGKIDPIREFTMQEIADKFELPVEQIRIKK